MYKISVELHFLRSGKKYEKELVLGEEILAGKPKECDINIDIDLTHYFGKKVPIKTMKTISRRHFKIAHQTEGVVIFDLSMNGTRVNDEDLKRSPNPKVLYDGDIILLAEKEEFQIEVKLPTETIPITPENNQEGTIPIQDDKVTPGLYFDQANTQFIVDGYTIPETEFTPSQYDVLKLLCENVGQVYSPWTIAQKASIGQNTVPQIIRQLRDMLDTFSEKSGKKYIKNKRWRGYYIYKVPLI